MQCAIRAYDRLMFEELESRRLMNAGGVDVALVDNTLPNYQALIAAAQGKVISYDGLHDSPARVLTDH